MILLCTNRYVQTGTGWVASDDGFLVLDRDGNGSIDTGRELFGDATFKSNGQTAADGFDALADLDSNADGKVGSDDTRYADLRVWCDLNQDGVSQSGELFTLAELGIASINVASTEHSQILADGNQLADTGTYTRTDGTTGTAGEISGNLGCDLGDNTLRSSLLRRRLTCKARLSAKRGRSHINLATDTFYRQFTDTLDNSAVAGLPDMQGSGAVRDLREAASQSTTLAASLASLSPDMTRAQLQAVIPIILQQWADGAAFADSFEAAPSDLFFVPPLKPFGTCRFESRV